MKKSYLKDYKDLTSYGDQRREWEESQEHAMEHWVRCAELLLAAPNKEQLKLFMGCVLFEYDAISLLRMNPNYTNVIHEQLLSNPDIALYAVRTEGEYKDARNFAPDIRGIGSNSVYPVYFQWSEPSKMVSILEKNQGLYNVFQMIERLVAGASRDVAMTFVDRFIEFKKISGSYVSLESLFSSEYFIKNSGRTPYHPDWNNRIYRNLSDPFSICVVDPDTYVEKLILNLEELISFYFNPQKDQKNVANAIEIYNQSIPQEKKDMPFFSVYQNRVYHIHLVTDKEKAIEYLSMNPRAATIIHPDLFNDWEVSLYLVRNEADLNAREKEHRPYQIDATPLTSSFFPICSQLEPEFYTVFEQLENYCLGCSRDALIKLIQHIVSVKKETGVFPAIPNREEVVINPQFFQNFDWHDIVTRSVNRLLENLKMGKRFLLMKKSIEPKA